MKMNTYVSGSWQNIVFTEKFSVELFSTVWSVLISGSCLLRWLPMPNSTNCIFRESIYIFFKYVESRLFNFNAVTAYIVIILMGELKLLFLKITNLRVSALGISISFENWLKCWDPSHITCSIISSACNLNGRSGKANVFLR